MNRLLLANIMRLKKNNIFWIGFTIMLLSGIIVPIIKYNDMKSKGGINTLDSGFLYGSLIIGIILSIFCSLFIGTEYSDGTMRNKIIVGHKRWEIYVSNLAVNAIVSILFSVSFMTTYLILGVPLLGVFKLELVIVFWFVIVSLLLSIAFSSIFNLISMLISSKAIGSISCILVAFLLLISGVQLNKMLTEPQMNRGIVVTDNGQKYDEVPNPNYIEGEQRKNVQLIYDFLPGGQVIQCITIETKNLRLLPVYSTIIIIISTTLGVALFSKKEIK